MKQCNNNPGDFGALGAKVANAYQNFASKMQTIRYLLTVSFHQHGCAYGSVSAGREKWLFNFLFFLKVEPPCDQT